MTRPTALVVACCAAKLVRPAPASELYQNREWNLIRRHELMLEAHSVGIYAFSAEHGLVPSTTILEPYDRKMTQLRSQQMAIRLLSRHADEMSEYREIWVYGGQNYRWPIKALADCLEVPCYELVGAGRGCGDHYAALAEYIDSFPTTEA